MRYFFTHTSTTQNLNTLTVNAFVSLGFIKGSQFEYASQVWAPHQLKYINKIERDIIQIIFNTCKLRYPVRDKIETWRIWNYYSSLPSGLITWWISQCSEWCVCSINLEIFTNRLQIELTTNPIDGNASSRMYVSYYTFDIEYRYSKQTNFRTNKAMGNESNILPISHIPIHIFYGVEKL